MRKPTLAQVKAFEGRFKPEERPGWYGTHITRKITPYLTWLLLLTPITANQVTVLQTVVGVLGGVLLATGNSLVRLAGLLCLQIGYMLDCVDGEIARYRKSESVNGVYIDLIGHYYVLRFMFFGLGLGEYLRTGRLEAAILGFVAAVFTVNVASSTRDNVVMSMLRSEKDSVYDYKSLRKGGGDVARPRRSRVRHMYDSVKHVFTYPASMNVIATVVVLDFLTSGLGVWKVPLGFAYLALIFYAVAPPLKEMLLIADWVKNNRVEQEYLRVRKKIEGSKGEAGSSKRD